MTTPMPHQMSIDGEELSAHELTVPGIGTVEWPAQETLSRTTRVRLSLDVVVTHVRDGAAVDAGGVAKESIRRSYIGAVDKASIRASDVRRPGRAEAVA